MGLPESSELTADDFAKEPPHSSRLSVLDQQPYNAAPEVKALVAHEITPEELVYCRNHGAIRQLDASSVTLSIGGLVKTPMVLNLATLKSDFERVEIVAALQCAGNRRATMEEQTGKEVEGLKWGESAVANCRWVGVRLRDVLFRAGFMDDAAPDSNDIHVCFASHVSPCQEDGWYGASIPLKKATGKEEDVMIAYEMNGAPLSYDRGYPFRIIVPGFTAARWVKWVDAITISHTESSNFYQKRDYKVLPLEVQSHDQANSEEWWERVPPILESPITSAVASCEPISPSSHIFLAKGYAMPGAGGAITRVEISADDGAHWTDARITYVDGRWSWALWEAELELPPAQHKCSVFCRATDAAGTTQPQESKWNLRGVAYGAWGKIDI